MSATHPLRPSQSTVEAYDGAVAFSDLTARARIREAALQHFAEVGYERATIRAIARTAGVSPGLLRHHYGSKDQLRAACDGYVFEMLYRTNVQLLDEPGASASTHQSAKRFGRYIARSLADATTASGAAIFDEMVTITERRLARADQIRSDPPTIQRRTRAAVLTAMAAGPRLMHDHISRTLGTDMFEPEGERLVALAMIDIYSHNVLDEQGASAAAEHGFNRHTS